jgi:two-component system, chemotaxis family, protein-glutamate methylesterase/glutaminase
VIALVASAGGVDALTRVLAPLPRGFGAAVIALQHQSPDRKSMLSEVLEARTKLDVVRATDGEHLQPGCVYVVPEGQHLLTLPDGSISLIVSGVVPPNRPSADLLLTSLAVSLGRAAIAVVLSGGGHDGATGATAVHDLGGIVIAADEASSQQFSMPKAAIGRDDAVDYVLDVDDIAMKLKQLVG